MISVKSGDPDQINDDSVISKDMNRSTDKFQDPISIQDDVQSFEMQSGLLPKSETEVGRKLDGEKNVLLLFYFKEFY